MHLAFVGHKFAQKDRTNSYGGSLLTSPDRGGRSTGVAFIDNYSKISEVLRVAEVWDTTLIDLGLLYNYVV